MGLLARVQAGREAQDGWCQEHRRLRSNCWPHGHQCSPVQRPTQEWMLRAQEQRLPVKVYR